MLYRNIVSIVTWIMLINSSDVSSSSCFLPCKLVLRRQAWHNNQPFPNKHLHMPPNSQTRRRTMISTEKVAEIVRDLYGLSGSASALGSCQDINFKFTTSNEHKALAKSYVVKFTNTSVCTVPEIEFQHAVIEYLHACKECTDIALPLPLVKGEMYRNSPSSTDNDCISEVEVDGNRYFVRLLTYVDGIILSEFTYFSPDVLHSFGAFVGSISKSLIGFQTYLSTKPHLRAVANREIEWYVE